MTKKVLIFSEEETNGFDAPATSEAIAEMLESDGWVPTYVSYGGIAKALSKQNYDMIAFPGADGDSCDFCEDFTKSDLDAITNYVKSGGLYLGICMGAAIAQLQRRYKGLALTYKNGQTISKARGSIYGVKEALKKVTMSDGSSYTIYIEDPPNLGRIKNSNEVTVLGTYDDSGTTCAFMSKYGDGGYALISAHPEADPTWGAGLKDTSAYQAGIYVVRQLLTLKRPYLNEFNLVK